MISLCSCLDAIYYPKASFMQALCLQKAFKGTPLEADVWVQKIGEEISAVISRYSGRLNIYSNGKNIEELREFINILGFFEIFCEESTAKALGFNTYSSFTVLKKKSKKTEEFSNDIGLSALYRTLKDGEDGEISLPDFEVFAPDVSHRLRHGGGVAVLEESGAALAFCCSMGGIINGIAVNRSVRKKGIGSKLLTDICRYIEGDVFVCTTNSLTDFYTKNGFDAIDKAVIIRGLNGTVF